MCAFFEYLFWGTLDNHTDIFSILERSNDCSLSPFFRAERNNAFKFAQSLSVREQLVNWLFALLQEFKHGYLGRISHWFINSVQDPLSIINYIFIVSHLKARVIVHDNAASNDFLNLGVLFGEGIIG